MSALYLCGGIIMLVAGLLSIAKTLGWLARISNCAACGHHALYHGPFSGCVAARVPGLDKPCGCGL